jgi:predicted GNAT family acetyltransferase
LKENKHTKKISELTPDEEEKIQTQLGKEIHCNFNPLLGMADEDASIILYKDDDPVAWMTFERKGSDALYISRLYVKDKYRNKGFFFPVICSAFDNTPEEIKRYFFYVNGNNKNMLGLLRAFNFSEIQQEKVIEMVKKL